MINDYDKDMMRELESSEMEQVSGGFDLSATPSAPPMILLRSFAANP